MYKLKVKIFGSWGDFYESDTNRVQVIFKTQKEAEKEMNKRIEMFGKIYKIEEV